MRACVPSHSQPHWQRYVTPPHWCQGSLSHTNAVARAGCVVDVEAVFEELAPLADAGIDTQGRLKISDRAQLLFGYHKVIDGAMEAARGGKGLGTTRKGACAARL